MISPIEALKTAVASYEPYLQPSGQMIDPIIGQPTQYGTPYHALGQAVLALHGDPADREDHLNKAIRGFEAALTHVADPDMPLNISGMQRETGQVSRINHRDFFWPPLLKIYRIFKALDIPETRTFATRLAAVDIQTAFRSRPPSNWAMVWLSGEWARFREGLSPLDLAKIDGWLGIFFENHVLLDQGLYQEPGHPNSYDLFTRYHMADMILDGYDGAWREQMEKLMETGLERSLRVQLSDGSLASAHRSTGQTWTLGIQCAYFTHAANYFRTANQADKAAQATGAAQRAFASFVRWQRPDGPYSPVENTLPPSYRVGYESYTADGHYANLAMGFLAVAIANGFEEPASLEQPHRSPLTFIEGDPTYRAIAHRGPYSLHVNACPAPKYDGFGLVDLTFGPGRRLHFVSSVRHLAAEKFYNLGLAIRQAPGLSELIVLAQQDPRLVGQIEPGSTEASFILQARVKGSPYIYELSGQIYDDGVFIEERTPNLVGYKTLLVPYLRDGGWPEKTRVDVMGSMIRFTLGRERLCFEIYGKVENALHLPYGYENRRGLCGLLRLDLAEPLEGISYRIVREV